MTSIIAIVHVTAMLTTAILMAICLISAIRIQYEAKLPLLGNSGLPAMDNPAAQRRQAA